MIAINPQRTDGLIDELVVVWTKSVQATHLFLTAKDIELLTPLVRAGLMGIDDLCVLYHDNQAVGFVGIASHKIEMMFLHPQMRGQGYGKQLVQLAFDKYRVQYVDVNEQNEQATMFYQTMGFEVFARSEYDEQGNKFPILKMRQK